TELGYKLRPQTYETVWIDLTVSLQEIRKGLDSKWRNGLNKSEQQELKVTVDQQGRWLTSFLKSYQEFKQDKGFLGPSLDFMKEEFLAAQPMQKSILILAQQSGLHVAGLMIMMHGRSASYRIGWNSELGKKTNAHSLLLWKAIEFLKEKGMTSLDLGGVKSKESPGITHFKTGMGGEYVQLLGFFS
ncbi:MAG: peptidoglycan bridge formation glycyltransferase FemA/FemB family protein, partial [Pseudobdellovibrionaceae bacterium]